MALTLCVGMPTSPRRVQWRTRVLRRVRCASRSAEYGGVPPIPPLYPCGLLTIVPMKIVGAIKKMIISFVKPFLRR